MGLMPRSSVPLQQIAGSVGDFITGMDATCAIACRYMKLRLDRVLFVEVSGSQDEVTQCGAPVPEFTALDKQDKKWTAPYTPYAKGWWDVFMPGKVEK